MYKDEKNSKEVLRKGLCWKGCCMWWWITLHNCWNMFFIMFWCQMVVLDRMKWAFEDSPEDQWIAD